MDGIKCVGYFATISQYIQTIFNIIGNVSKVLIEFGNVSKVLIEFTTLTNTGF